MIKAIKTLMVLPLVLAIFLLICSFINTAWEVSHEGEINASPSQVWSLLSDLEGYSDWNRYSPNVKGTFSVGEVVWVEAHLDNEVRHVQNYIISIIPEQELCWESADWFGRLANGRRCRWLTATALG